MANEPTVESIFADLGGPARMAWLLGRPDGTVYAWKSRKVLPPEVWKDLVALAKREKLPGITYDRLHDLYYGREKCDAGR